MLNDLQIRVARMVARLSEAEGFALAGGAGLIVHQVTERETSDLDFFTPDAARVARLLPALEQALQADGLEVTRQRVEQDFVRLTVTYGAEATVIDLSPSWQLRASARRGASAAAVPSGIEGSVGPSVEQDDRQRGRPG